jgi:8-oxo-dGTP pyrophosphatase MutT (NUDIX family)
MQTTLCLLLKEGEILLAMKKRGFGVGRWNGVGGKMDAKKGDKSIVDAVVRETKEEIGVDIINPEKVGIFHFRFPYKPEWDQDVHLFLAREWKGTPEESEEMAPKWFSRDQLPYDQMWDDDKLWMPHILKGEKLEADFIFREGEIIDKHIIKVI